MGEQWVFWSWRCVPNPFKPQHRFPKHVKTFAGGFFPGSKQEVWGFLRVPNGVGTILRGAVGPSIFGASDAERWQCGRRKEQHHPPNLMKWISLGFGALGGRPYPHGLILVLWEPRKYHQSPKSCEYLQYPGKSVSLRSLGASPQPCLAPTTSFCLFLGGNTAQSFASQRLEFFGWVWALHPPPPPRWGWERDTAPSHPPFSSPEALQNTPRVEKTQV